MYCVTFAYYWGEKGYTFDWFLSLKPSVSQQGRIVNHVIINTVFNLLQLGLSCVRFILTHKGRQCVILSKENRQYVKAAILAYYKGI